MAPWGPQGVAPTHSSNTPNLGREFQRPREIGGFCFILRRIWWWTGRLGVLRFVGSQRVGHDWATELNWTEGTFTTSPGEIIASFSRWDDGRISRRPRLFGGWSARGAMRRLGSSFALVSLPAAAQPPSFPGTEPPVTSSYTACEQGGREKVGSIQVSFLSLPVFPSLGAARSTLALLSLLAPVSFHISSRERSISQNETQAPTDNCKWVTFGWGWGWGKDGKWSRWEEARHFL